MKAGSHVCLSPAARHRRFPPAYSRSRARARPPARPFWPLSLARPLSRLDPRRAAVVSSRCSRLLAPPPLVVAMFKRPRPAGDAPTSRLYPLPPVPLPRPTVVAELLPRAALLAPAPVVSTPLENPGLLIRHQTSVARCVRICSMVSNSYGMAAVVRFQLYPCFARVPDACSVQTAIYS